MKNLTVNFNSVFVFNKNLIKKNKRVFNFLIYFFFFSRITSPFNKRKIKEIPASKQLLHPQQLHQQQQQQPQNHYVSNIPTPKKFAFNGSNMMAAFNNSSHSNSNTNSTNSSNTSNAAQSGATNSSSGLPVYHASIHHDTYQHNNGSVSQQSMQQNSSRIHMKMSNGHATLSSTHFASSESTSSGKRDFPILNNRRNSFLSSIFGTPPPKKKDLIILIIIVKSCKILFFLTQIGYRRLKFQIQRYKL